MTSLSYPVLSSGELKDKENETLQRSGLVPSKEASRYSKSSAFPASHAHVHAFCPFAFVLH